MKSELAMYNRSLTMADNRKHAKQFYFWIMKKCFLHIDQIRGHLRANGFAGRKEKIGNINFAFIIFLGDGFAVLVGKRKIGNVVFVGNVLYGRVHQFWIYIGWIVNGKRFFGFQCKIKQGISVFSWA